MPILSLEFVVPATWDYDASIAKVRAVTYKWRELTEEIFTELLVAREALSRPGNPHGKRTWGGYCEEIGVPQRTANDWLLRLTEQNRQVTAHVGQATGENEWYTPKEYIEPARTVLGNIELDPCSTAEADEVVMAQRYYDIEQDGLQKHWEGAVWMNPPYASDLVGKFTKKLIRHFVNKDVPKAVVLVNNATETEWFQDLAGYASAICFPEHRVKFWSPRGEAASPLQGQAVIYLGDNVPVFRDRFEHLGIIVYGS
jgi:hypothetical protein